MKLKGIISLLILAGIVVLAIFSKNIAVEVLP
jgi:hypothetical protein